MSRWYDQHRLTKRMRKLEASAKPPRPLAPPPDPAKPEDSMLGAILHDAAFVYGTPVSTRDVDEMLSRAFNEVPRTGARASEDFA